jgi:hypothetical protein
LVALFMVAPLALTFLLFFTRLPSSFERPMRIASKIQVSHFLRCLGLPHSPRCEQIDRHAPGWDLAGI